jgi:hypothetical protein
VKTISGCEVEYEKFIDPALRYELEYQDLNRKLDYDNLIEDNIYEIKQITQLYYQVSERIEKDDIEKDLIEFFTTEEIFNIIKRSTIEKSTDLINFIKKNNIEKFLPIIDRIQNQLQHNFLNKKQIMELFVATDKDYSELAKKNSTLAEVLGAFNEYIKDVIVYHNVGNTQKAIEQLNESKHLIQQYIDVNNLLKEKGIEPIKSKDVTKLEVNGEAIYKIKI